MLPATGPGSAALACNASRNTLTPCVQIARHVRVARARGLVPAGGRSFTQQKRNWQTAAAAADQPGDKDKPEANSGGILDIFRVFSDPGCNKKLLALAIGQMLCSVATLMHDSYLPVYVQDELGLSNTKVGWPLLEEMGGGDGGPAICRRCTASMCQQPAASPSAGPVHQWLMPLPIPLPGAVAARRLALCRAWPSSCAS